MENAKEQATKSTLTTPISKNKSSHQDELLMTMPCGIEKGIQKPTCMLFKCEETQYINTYIAVDLNLNVQF